MCDDDKKRKNFPDFVTLISIRLISFGTSWKKSGSYLLEVNEDKNHTLFISLSKTEDYWKVISGGVFRLKYSRNKKKVYSVPAIRMPEPVSQAKVPASGEIQQDSTEASGDSL